MNTKTASMVLGFIFIALGLLGFVPNPVIANSHDAIFHADTVHSMVHIISGILFLVFAFAAPGRAGLLLKVFGAVYFLLGVMGLFTTASDEMTRLLGFLHVNSGDNHLHVALGVVILLAGMLKDPVVD
jgi:hypothetical protein